MPDIEGQEGAASRPQGPPNGPPWHALAAEQVLAQLDTGLEGLGAATAAARLAEDGPNELRRARGPGVWALLFRQVNNPIVYLLLMAGSLAIALGKLTDGVVVWGAIAANVLIGFFQEFRAGRVLEALSRMVPEDAAVTRDGVKSSVPAASLVRGDLVHLAQGNRVPADLRLLHLKRLSVDEAALTGESVPVGKGLDPVAEDAALGDRLCMAYGGTLVRSGVAMGVVVATGPRTELGRISALLSEATPMQTPLTRAIAHVGRWLTAGVVLVSAVLLALSLFRGYPLSDALLVGIALAVAVIPEGLPAIITIALAIGVQRMARRRAVVRKLPSVETLGSTTVICTDKTGTLTRNEMTVQALWTRAGSHSFTGVGYQREGELRDAHGLKVERLPPELESLLVAGVLCNDAELVEGAAAQISGDPTEGALLVAAEKAGLRVAELKRAWPRLDAIPFESERQFMATLHRAPGEARFQVVLKGAPEVVLRRCRLEQDERARVHQEVSRMASQGMRVLALGSATLPGEGRELRSSEVAQGLTLLGLQGMMDPPRLEAIEAVKACQQAGVTVKMMTGDHLETAEAIGQLLQLQPPGARGLTGRELTLLDEPQLRRAALTTQVFARVAPEQKLKLVRALQAEKQVVAVTGDGVNDAPALKQANIGVAMGVTGTAVSKEAADVVLADDNFATIAAAVEEGRRIYDNLLKSLAFVLPTNLGLGFILIAAVLFFPIEQVGGVRLPLMPARPTQLLWINLVASVALSLPLAFEVAEPEVMRRPPRDPRAPLFGPFLVVRTVVTAVLLAAGAVGLFGWEYAREVGRLGHLAALREAQTMAVTTVVFFQIFYLFTCRSLTGSVLKLGLFANRAVFVGLGVLVVLQAGFIYLPAMQRLFGTAALSVDELLRSAAVATLILPAVALEKFIRRRWTRRRFRGGPLARSPQPG